MAIQDKLVKRILQAYGISRAKVSPPQKGYRNQSFPVELHGGAKVNLILYKSEPGILAKIKAANAAGDFLACLDFPVRHALDRRIIRLRTPGRVKYGSLYNYLPGETIPWEAYTKDHIKQLGKAMSDVHAALRHFEYSGLPDAADEYLSITARITAYFKNQNVQQALAQKLGLQVSANAGEKLENLLKVCKQLPNKHPLHMDFVRSNILFENQPQDGLKVRISGILDFEKIACGDPSLDIARTLSFLLVDCKYKPSHKIKKYFVHSGYNKRGATQMPRSYMVLTERLCDLFWFYDFYKFLRHNPYEYLHRNEHFVRTKTLLLKRQLISEHTVK